MKRDYWLEAIKKGILIGHFFTGKTSKEENNRLRIWREEQKSHERLLEETVSPKRLRENIETYKHLAAKAEWNALHNRLRNRKKKIYYRIAVPSAVAAILCGICLVYILSSDRQSLPVAISDNILPGSHKATLYIEEGSIIPIRENMEAVLVPDSSIIVKNNLLVQSKSSLHPKTTLSRSIVTPRGGEYSLSLMDGTKVWLNADSRLTFPANFGELERVVELEGEAYFEVAENKKIPFIVKTFRSQTQVYGTAFNINAYPDDSRQKITLERGSIGVTVGKKEYMLQPNKQIILSNNGSVEILPVDAQKQSVWRNGNFIFEKENLEDIMNQLARWYDVEILFTDAQTRQLHFSGKLNRYDHIEQLLNMIELTTHIKFKIEKRTIIIYTQ